MLRKIWGDEIATNYKKSMIWSIIIFTLHLILLGSNNSAYDIVTRLLAG
jgi:hypothetical protein